MHDLYFGTDKAAVESGAASVLQGITLPHNMEAAVS